MFGFLFLESTDPTAGSQKRKTTDDGENDPPSRSSKIVYNRSASTKAQEILQRKIDSLEAQILEYQTTWMRK